MNKNLYIVKLESPIKDKTTDEMPSGEITKIYKNPEDIAYDCITENEEVFYVSWPVMHRICQMFGWKYDKMLEK